MALTRHHPGGPDRTYLSITLPGSEKNGVYSHDEVDGHPTRREYVDTVIKAKDDNDTLLSYKAYELTYDLVIKSFQKTQGIATEQFVFELLFWL